jgi:hypothetical protein
MSCNTASRRCVIPDQALMREDLLDCLELTDALDRLFGNVGTGGDVDIKELAPTCGKNRPRRSVRQ